MRQVIEVTYTDAEGVDRIGELPARFEVCSRCEGHGTHLNPSIGEYAYTAEEFDEAFDDDESRVAYFTRGGMFDVRCAACDGKRVVLAVDVEAVEYASAEVKAIFAHYKAQREDEAYYRRICQLERMMGC